MAAGWKVEKVYLKAQIVIFRRKGANPLTSVPWYIEGLLNGATHYGRPTPNTLASWLRFCKRVGWYFEAPVLYERGGLNMDMLSESEYAEVDEELCPLQARTESLQGLHKCDEEEELTWLIPTIFLPPD